MTASEQPHVRIFDTTLRDGEQAPGISLDAKEKLEIAEQLARLNADYIEAGFPITSQGEFEAVRGIAETVGTQVWGSATAPPVITSLARCHPDDVKRAADAMRSAQRSRIHVFLSTSDIHRHVLHHGASEDEIVAQAQEGIRQALEFTDDVEFSPQDATRTDKDFLKRIVEAAVEAGATTVNIPDTVGYAIPYDFGATIGDLVRRVGPEVAISVHCHNDLGLAVANSIEAVRQGARQIEVAVNGIGERAGNCSLEEVVMALATRNDLLGLGTQIDTVEIGRTSRLVSTLTGYNVQYNKAVVGKNAFAHESGIHQHGVLQDRLTYEIMDAASVGMVGSQIVLGKHSGRHAFSRQLEDMGYELGAEEIKRAFDRFKELSDKKVEVTDADLEAIVADEISAAADEAFELEDLEVTGGTAARPHAVVRIRRSADAVVFEESAGGDGMVDAACGAIRRAVGEDATHGAALRDARLADFKVAAVTGGIDALGDVTVQVDVAGQRYTGRGVSTDVVEASARAFLSALNRSVRLQRVQATTETP